MKDLKARVALVLLTTFILSACNTMQGAGRDVERAGEKVQGAAQRNR